MTNDEEQKKNVDEAPDISIEEAEKKEKAKKDWRKQVSKKDGRDLAMGAFLAGLMVVAGFGIFAVLIVLLFKLI